jgi:hypothetical protein
MQTPIQTRTHSQELDYRSTVSAMRVVSGLITVLSYQLNKSKKAQQALKWK